MRIQVGDIFSLDNVPDRAIGIVQDIRKCEFFITLFCSSEGEDFSRLWVPRLCGLTLDAKFYHGSWKVERNREEVARTMPAPVFSVLWNGEPKLETVSCDLVDHSACESSDALPVPRITVAPVRFENAMQSVLLGEPWQDSFDKIQYNRYFKPSACDSRYRLD